MGEGSSDIEVCTMDNERAHHSVNSKRGTTELAPLSSVPSGYAIDRNSASFREGAADVDAAVVLDDGFDRAIRATPEFTPCRTSARVVGIDSSLCQISHRLASRRREGTSKDDWRHTADWGNEHDLNFVIQPSTHGLPTSVNKSRAGRKRNQACD
jgi:hypothetical protein